MAYTGLLMSKMTLISMHHIKGMKLIIGQVQIREAFHLTMVLIKLIIADKEELLVLIIPNIVHHINHTEQVSTYFYAK